MHNFNFLVFFPYSLEQYLSPPKRIRIIHALVFGPAIYTDRHTDRHTHRHKVKIPGKKIVYITYSVLILRSNLGPL